MDLATHGCRRAADALKCVGKSFPDTKPTFPDAVTALAKLYFVVVVYSLFAPSSPLRPSTQA